VHESDLATASLARFGVFELDAERRELRRTGMLIALQGQPFDLLVMLLRRPNELVLRNEIEDKFWAGDRYGDLDGRVNFAIREIRKALDDNADKPHYVATVRNRGYKLIVPVRWSESGKPDVVARSAGQSLDDDAQTDSSRNSPRKRTIQIELEPYRLVLVGLALAVALSFLVLDARRQDHRRQEAHETNIDATAGNGRLVPVITSVTHIGPAPKQRILIIGHGFGTYTAYANQDTPFVAIRDTTTQWAAGRITPANWDEVTLSVSSWTDSEIDVTEFSGAYGKQGWKLRVGDKIEIAVWNPQTRAGPGIYHLNVTEEADP
jgi:DNA-binding winged helix-turn-helix (wHTH) protein